MYCFIASFVFKVLKISPPQKVGNVIFFPFFLSLIILFLSLILLSFFTKLPIIFKISVFKSNKLTGFGLSSISFDLTFFYYLLFDITFLLSILFDITFLLSFI